MKNLLLIFGLILGFLTNTIAQELNQDKTKFGVKIGSNLTTLGVLNLNGKKYDYAYKLGFTAGVFSEIPLMNKLKLIPELNYSQKGGDAKADTSGFPLNIEQRLIYIDVPIALSYTVTPNLSVFAGPQVSFIYSQKTTNTTQIFGVPVVETNTDTKKIAKAIPGAVIGMSLNLSNINLSGRYMSDLSKGSKDKDPRFTDVRNSGFALTVGYKF